MMLTIARPALREIDRYPLMPRKPFGRYLRDARMDVDLTQETLAKAWGKSQTTVSDIERTAGTDDEVIPKRKDIPALAAAIQRPVNEVYRAAGYEPDIAEITYEPDPDAQAIVDTYMTTTPTNKAILKAMADKIRELDRGSAIGGGIAPAERETN